MSHRKTLLAASIFAALCTSGALHAQDSNAPAPADAGQATDLEAVTVTGIRQSLKKSLDTKRESDAIVEAITAEDIGKFPNTNVAEAIALMPGITLDRRFGQGERVSIDGTDPSLNLSFLDGHPVAQVVWLYGDQPNRGFDYTLMAPEILGRLEVYKSPEARLPEGSLGGTVLMHTRKPLDMDANSISTSLSYNYNDQASTGRPSFSGLYSWKNADETFGINIAAQHFEEQIDRQGFAINNYHRVSDYAARSPGVAAQVARGELSPNALVPDGISAAYFQQTRERESAVVNLQFKPNSQWEANLSGLYIREDYSNHNQAINNFLYWNNATIGAVDHLVQGPNGLVVGGHSSGQNAAVVYSNNVRHSVVTTKGADVRVTYRGDGWSVSGQAGGSKSENPNLAQTAMQSVYNGGFSWDARQGYTFDDPASGHNPANWGGSFMGNYITSFPEAKDAYGQIDFSKNFNSPIYQVLFGVRYNKHDESLYVNTYTGLRQGTLADIGTVGYTDTMHAYNGFSRDQARHVEVSAGQIRKWTRNSNIDWAHPDPASFLANSFQQRQENTAAYVQANFGFDALRGNVGLRHVHSVNSSWNYVPPGGVPLRLPAPQEWWKKIGTSKDYLLPSFNLIYDATSDIVLRLSGAKVVAWAPYNQMVNSTFLDNASLTGNGGNGSLDPYKSVNVNFSAEWYFAEQSALSVSIFHKHILNFVNAVPAIERYYNVSKDTDPDHWARLIGSNGCTADGYCDYNIQRPQNAGSAKIKGATLSYQQAFGETGFGVITNYTYADGDTDQGKPMPYTSKNSLSLSPYYEKGPLSVRLNYNWRSSYLAGGFVASTSDIEIDDYTDVGASIGWQFNENLGVSFDAMNLLNEKYHRYAYGNKDQFFNSYTTGRRYMATLRVSF